MELLERYLGHVNTELSSPNSQEIIRELKSNILDEIDSIEMTNKTTVSDSQLAEVLKGFGHPVQVAQRYEPQAALVAGADMPFFKTILWHGTGIVFVFALLNSTGNLINVDSINPIRFLLQTLFSFLDNIGLMLIVITVVFYYLGKTGNLQQRRYQNWSPNNLAKNPSAKLKLSDAVTDLSTSAFILLILWTPLWMSTESQQSLLISLASENEYWRYILTALSLLSIIFALYRLTQQSWSKSTLGIYIVDHALFAVAFLVMASQSDFFVLLPDTLAEADINTNWHWFKDYIGTTIHWSFTIIGVIAGGSAAYYAWLLTKLK